MFRLIANTINTKEMMGLKKFIFRPENVSWFYLNIISSVERNVNFRGAAIAQWNRQRLPFCHPGFKSQTPHLFFHRFIELLNVEKTKVNKKRPRGA